MRLSLAALVLLIAACTPPQDDAPGNACDEMELRSNIQRLQQRTVVSPNGGVAGGQFHDRLA